LANIINGTDTGSGGLITTGDSSDELQIQTAETTAITITSGQQSAFIAGHGCCTSGPYHGRLVNSGDATSIGDIWCTLAQILFQHDQTVIAWLHPQTLIRSMIMRRGFGHLTDASWCKSYCSITAYTKDRQVVTVKLIITFHQQQIGSMLLFGLPFTLLDANSMAEPVFCMLDNAIHT
jgi:hypothetical protein